MSWYTLQKALQLKGLRNLKSILFYLHFTQLHTFFRLGLGKVFKSHTYPFHSSSSLSFNNIEKKIKGNMKSYEI